MSAFLFTIDAIEKLESPAAGRKEYHDTECPGLTVIVTRAGTKTFYRYGRVNGKPQRTRIGRFPQWSVSGARKQCKILTGKIAQGHDPQEERRVTRRQKTVGELWTWYFENCSKGKKALWKKELALWEKRVGPKWSKRAVPSIERHEVKEFHNEIMNGTPGTVFTGGHFSGDRFLAMIRHMWAEAIENGWAVQDPTRGIEFATKVKRRRYLTEAEMPRFFEHLTALPRAPRDYFLLKIILGARSINILSMRWGQLNFVEKVWEIPWKKSKNRDSMFIPLPDYAIEILIDRKSITGDSPFVFPGRTACGHAVCFKRYWKQVITAAKLENIRPHDLRRTLGTWQKKQGSAMDTIAESLGHKSLESTKIYAVNEQEDVRESMNRAIRAILQASEKNSENS